ncbi:MAG: hydantoinase/oxoprolinase family protein [Gammaproteobacteria bacterium]|nr:MAG: hydantoinase/oxoprolinase family protein [Gammaproteobacteria bacterium]
MTTWLGVDVGGTFSDLVVYDDATGAIRVAKGLTTPAAQDEGVAAIVAAAVPAAQRANAGYFLHGSTVALNALLERKGAVVGLLTTAGFEDVLEIRRGDRDTTYQLVFRPPPPLVPRRLRFGVRERVVADGSIRTPIEEADVAPALAAFRAEGVECIAVIFLHSYANPAHELAAEQALRRLGFKGEISLSHRVSGEYREYERTSTTVVDAYVRPCMSTYLRRLEGRLRDLGFNGSCLVTRSGGGAMSFGEAEERPFEAIISGPVAGAIGAGDLCRQLNIANAVTADVGGTSFDTCLIQDGRPTLKYEGRVMGLPLQTSWIDVRSIGAGGGSLARVDAGLLQVGPESAGASPGPASYGRGGSRPTVTDAAAVLGMLAFGELASGLRLDFAAARAALKPLGPALGLDQDGVARGILQIAAANMANAIRTVTVQTGQDPRDCTLVAFGGAGPLFATLLARELAIREVLVPAHAGNFSALGLLTQDVTQSTARTSLATLDEQGLARANQVFGELLGELHRRGRAAASDGAQAEAALDLRYLGQEYTLAVSVPVAGGAIATSPAEVVTLFHRDYERTFGHTMENPVQILSVRAILRSPLPRRARMRPAAAQVDRKARREIEAFSFTRGRRVPFGVLERGSLPPEEILAGPALLLEETTTTYIDAGFEARVHESGALFLTDREA